MSKLPLQANVYPMSTMAYIQDAEYRLTLLAAQSLGTASMASGMCCFTLCSEVRVCNISVVKHSNFPPHELLSFKNETSS